MNKIRKCASCGKHTLLEKCTCGFLAMTAHPPKFSAKDKYVKYKAQKRD